MVQNKNPTSRSPNARQYDADTFYTRATDTRGHGERVSFKMPPDVYARIMKMVSSDEFPEYEQPADVIRDMVVHGLSRRAAQSTDPEFREKVDKTLGELAFWKQVDAINVNIQRRQQMRDNLRSALLTCEREKSWNEMEDICDSIEWSVNTADEPFATELDEMQKMWRKKAQARGAVDPGVAGSVGENNP